MKKGQGWAKQVTLENLPSFVNHLRSAQDRLASQKKFAEEAIKRVSKGTPSPFQGVPLSFPNRFPRKTRPPETQVKPTQPVSVAGHLATGSRGELLWQKRLNRSDAQQTSVGTNPTGCLRFTQARKENTHVIDQTKFFRIKLFGGFKWAEIKKSPYEEATQVPFHVTIKGKTLGIFELQVRHKPSGEAGQGNYTTSLHWGRKLINVIRDKTSAGNLFALYSPSQGSRSPFFIEIT